MSPQALKNGAMFALALVVVAFIAYNRSSRPWPIKHIPAQGNKVLFFGDEIPETFLYTQKDFEVIKVIENEATTAKLVKMIGPTIDAYHPDVIVISGGSYDLLAGTNWSEIYANMERIFETTDAHKVPVIYLGIYPTAGGDNYPFGIRDACKKYGVLLLDNMFEKVWHDGIEATIASLTPKQSKEMHESIFESVRSLYSDR